MSISLCPPAVRMLVIYAQVDQHDKDTDYIGAEYRLIPVVAVCGSSKMGTVPDDDDESHWSGTQMDLHQFDVIVVDDSEGLVGPASRLFGRVEHGDYRIVSCPWPPEQDEARLKDDIEEARQWACQKYRMRVDEGKSRPLWSYT